MKQLIFIGVVLAAIFPPKANAQNTLKGLAADTLVFTKAEHMPEFQGGINKFYKYLAQTIRYPAEAREKNIQGVVILSMIIEKDGSVTHVKVDRGVSVDIDKEAVRVLTTSPKWNPGMQNGHAIRCYYAMPLSFKLANG